MSNAPKITTIGLILILSSCSTKNLMHYYYPINSNSEIKIHKYINPNNSEFTEYWQTTPNSDQGTLLTESFNAELILYNTFEEKLSKEEAKLLKYVEYEKEPIFREIKATVLKDKVYNSNQTRPYNYAVKYENKYGRFTFEKKRQFIEFKEINIQKRTYKTAVFKDQYFIDAIDQNEKYEFYQYTYYARGIGMVKYERYIPTGEIRILELDKILTEREFEQIKNKTSR